MTLSEGRPFEVETTFLVSREGVATVRVDRFRPEAIHGLEIEPLAGEGLVLSGLVRRLAADAFRRLTPAGSSAHAPPDVDIPGHLAAGEAFARAARSCQTQMSANAQLLRSGSHREALHQLRVGVRRLRAAFAAFEPMLPGDALGRWKTETKWLAGELDTARDLDVFTEHLSASTTADERGDPVLAAFGERLILAQAMAYDRALAAVESKRFAAFMLDVSAWVEAAPWSSDDDVVSSVLAARALKRLHRQLRKAGGQLAALDPAGRHQVRIKAKKLRYAAEFFGNTFGRNARKRHAQFIASLARLQDALGELNDRTSARQCALAVAGRHAELAFRAGQLIGARSRDEPRLLARAVRAYERWSHARRFWA